MFIDRAFPDIASTRVRDLESAKASKKCREEKYAHSDLFDLLTIESMDRHSCAIEVDGALIPSDCDPERLDDREKCEDIANLRDIV
jgi:hypothetical protein